LAVPSSSSRGTTGTTRGDNQDISLAFDVVIANGRVIDPVTERDEYGLNVGILGDRIARITAQPLRGQRVIDARGRVVAPGFIDSMSYHPNPGGMVDHALDLGRRRRPVRIDAEGEPVNGQVCTDASFHQSHKEEKVKTVQYRPGWIDSSNRGASS
jgi:hypothetical protein